jgi:hypothetical protein
MADFGDGNSMNAHKYRPGDRAGHKKQPYRGSSRVGEFRRQATLTEQCRLFIREALLLVEYRATSRLG